MCSRVTAQDSRAGCSPRHTRRREACVILGGNRPLFACMRYIINIQLRSDQIPKHSPKCAAIAIDTSIQAIKQSFLYSFCGGGGDGGGVGGS